MVTKIDGIQKAGTTAEANKWIEDNPDKKVIDVKSHHPYLLLLWTKK